MNNCHFFTAFSGHSLSRFGPLPSPSRRGRSISLFTSRVAAYLCEKSTLQQLTTCSRSTNIKYYIVVPTGRIRVDYAVDVWSFGVVLHQLLHDGDTPHQHLAQRGRMALILALPHEKCAKVQQTSRTLEAQARESQGEGKSRRETECHREVSHRQTAVECQKVEMQ